MRSFNNEVAMYLLAESIALVRYELAGLWSEIARFDKGEAGLSALKAHLDANYSRVRRFVFFLDEDCYRCCSQPCDHALRTAADFRVAAAQAMHLDSTDLHFDYQRFNLNGDVTYFAVHRDIRFEVDGICRRLGRTVEALTAFGQPADFSRRPLIDIATAEDSFIRSNARVQALESQSLSAITSRMPARSKPPIPHAVAPDPSVPPPSAPKARVDINADVPDWLAGGVEAKIKHAAAARRAQPAADIAEDDFTLPDQEAAQPPETVTVFDDVPLDTPPLVDLHEPALCPVYYLPIDQEEAPTTDAHAPPPEAMQPEDTAPDATQPEPDEDPFAEALPPPETSPPETDSLHSSDLAVALFGDSDTPAQDLPVFLEASFPKAVYPMVNTALKDFLAQALETGPGGNSHQATFTLAPLQHIEDHVADLATRREQAFDIFVIKPKRTSRQFDLYRQLNSLFDSREMIRQIHFLSMSDRFQLSWASPTEELPIWVKQRVRPA
jgi:hypothetical protein